MNDEMKEGKKGLIERAVERFDKMEHIVKGRWTCYMCEKEFEMNKGHHVKIRNDQVLVCEDCRKKIKFINTGR